MNEEISHPKGIEYIQIKNENFYKIKNVGAIRPFFMSIVSDSNHWMFISSNGGISAGRKNSEYALFPYYTEDKITDSAEQTGSKTIFQVLINSKKYIWEPFSVRSESEFRCERNVYKSRYGNKVIFEEINYDLGIGFQYEWNSSNLFGFVRIAKLINHSSKTIEVKLIDGLQNILPYGVGSDLQNSTSNLADAYKRTELIPDCGLGIFALSAIIVDKAEPSEALKANVAWSLGFNKTTYLLSSAQLSSFRKGGSVQQEEDVKGAKGFYFIYSEIKLAAKEEKEWVIVANVNQSQAAVIELAEKIKNSPTLSKDVLEDVETGTRNLIALTAASDGLQYTSDNLSDTRHYSNVLFNIMRGGIFDEGYTISKKDFVNYFQKASELTFKKNEQLILTLAEHFSMFSLKQKAAQIEDTDFIRLVTEYLPLKFSRRHGDPSRPWNRFTINTRSEIDGSKILDYEGNWRDIFQNWEALAFSYPAYIEGMIFKFLNASTFDGYNPYRVTKGGFDWETIEPDNPWSYIGYWGDHQIIYLLKFLEFAKSHYPEMLSGLLAKEYFVYANVPYKIKSYKDIATNPKDTIEYNHTADAIIRKRMTAQGADGALLFTSKQNLHHVNLMEKILATVLAKLTNLVPDGGIWLNTQRPEWNDANNALVGNGLSMVTLYYLRRFLQFFKQLVDSSNDSTFALSEEVAEYFTAVTEAFEKYSTHLSVGLNNGQKKKMLDELGEASSQFRTLIYSKDFSGSKAAVLKDKVKTFIDTAQQFIESSIKANKRNDGLYHTYNLLSYDDKELSISFLSEMLEGQVAVLSSGFLSPKESVELLDALKVSSLYRQDQYSYILYPNKELPGFLQKNNVPKQKVEPIALLQKLLANDNRNIIEKDIHGVFHFNGNIRNANDLSAALDNLEMQYQQLVQQDKSQVLQIFEEVFNHKAFTGRSGTFFAYEGLGSIYWHMVSKLLQSVQESYFQAVLQQADAKILQQLQDHYYEIKEGIGVHKSPELYGAFPTDPYSHTPLGKGAQQPGMTGQVKEDIISRIGELGVFVKEGQLYFDPCLLRKSEFLTEKSVFEYVDVNQESQQLILDVGTLCFTCCQVPVVYKLSSENSLKVFNKDKTTTVLQSLKLDLKTSQQIFEKTGDVVQIELQIIK